MHMELHATLQRSVLRMNLASTYIRHPSLLALARGVLSAEDMAASRVPFLRGRADALLHNPVVRAARDWCSLHVLLRWQDVRAIRSWYVCSCVFTA